LAKALFDASSLLKLLNSVDSIFWIDLWIIWIKAQPEPCDCRPKKTTLFPRFLRFAWIFSTHSSFFINFKMIESCMYNTDQIRPIEITNYDKNYMTIKPWKLIYEYSKVKLKQVPYFERFCCWTILNDLDLGVTVAQRQRCRLWCSMTRVRIPV
jgi:hypothetical protein